MNTEMERIAIERLKAFEPKDGDPYYLCYSGGKDSDCIRILAQVDDETGHVTVLDVRCGEMFTEVFHSIDAALEWLTD